MSEIGLKSLHCVAAGILGTGVMQADFHCVGTIDSLNESRYRYESGLAMPGAASFRNHAERPSRPEAVA